MCTWYEGRTLSQVQPPAFSFYSLGSICTKTAFYARTSISLYQIVRYSTAYHKHHEYPGAPVPANFALPLRLLLMVSSTHDGAPLPTWALGTWSAQGKRSQWSPSYVNSFNIGIPERKLGVFLATTSTQGSVEQLLWAHR